MKKGTRAGLIALGVATFATVGIAPANAATYSAACSTAGGNGSLVIQGFSYGDEDIPYVSLAVGDSKADGHHMRIRLVTQSMGGYTTYFPWRKNTAGAGEVRGWVTEAHPGYTIGTVWVEVARFEKDNKLNHCDDIAYPG